MPSIPMDAFALGIIDHTLLPVRKPCETIFYEFAMRRVCMVSRAFA